MDFNPRARVGRDLASFARNDDDMHFNPRARVGRDVHGAKAHGEGRNFNPRARVGRDLRLLRLRLRLLISIHAPAWGATFADGRRDSCGQISIHAPAWGATRLVGGEPPLLRISIHAPAWGATRLLLECLFHGVISIHAPAWGATRRRSAVCSTAPYFNPRARVGRDARSCERQGVCADFNPRARVGRDIDETPTQEEIQISIHAPAWGATALYEGMEYVPVFQSTRPRGARQACAGAFARGVRFQSTRPRGARR